jgi:hypothetical protein
LTALKDGPAGGGGDKILETFEREAVFMDQLLKVADTFNIGIRIKPVVGFGLALGLDEAQAFIVPQPLLTQAHHAGDRIDQIGLHFHPTKHKTGFP